MLWRRNSWLLCLSIWWRRNGGYVMAAAGYQLASRSYRRVKKHGIVAIWRKYWYGNGSLRGHVNGVKMWHHLLQLC